MSFRAASIKCQGCGKTVYAMEAMQADGKTFHKGCMKCAECNGVLKLGDYAAVGGKYYCKPHFKQLFKLKGNYSSGFGDDRADSKSHSFSVPTGRADFNKAAPVRGSPSTPVKAAPASPAASPAPVEKEPPKPAGAAVPQLASPSPVHRPPPTTTTTTTTTTTSSPARGLGSSGGGSFENDKKAFEAEKKAFEEERRKFEEERKKKDADLKAASGAAEKELAVAKEAAAAAAAATPEPTPQPITLSATESLICDAFCALLQDGVKKDLALKKVGLAK